MLRDGGQQECIMIFKTFKFDFLKNCVPQQAGKLSIQ